MSADKYKNIMKGMIKLADERKKLLQQLKELEEEEGKPYYQLASLCNWDHSEEVLNVFNRWKESGLEYLPPEDPGSQSGKLLFNSDRIKSSVFKDLALLSNHGALNCSINTISGIIVATTDLGESEESVRKRLIRCKKRFK